MILVACAPNFSEGHDHRVIQAITQAIAGVDRVRLLHVDSSRDANRTVVTFVGEPEAAGEAILRAVARASLFIDMAQHEGLHPRMGALDVCPFIPLPGMSMDECVQLARQVGERIGKEAKIPVFYYGAAASAENRTRLAEIRRGEYEGLEERMSGPDWQPDAGPTEFNAQLGATAVGAREWLIAYNVNLKAKGAAVAQAIALAIRETGQVQRDSQGRLLKDSEGQPLRRAGTLRACRARGWYLPRFGLAQVTMNLENWKVTPPHAAYEEVRRQAAMRDVKVVGSELVGMVPLAPMLAAGRYFLNQSGRTEEALEEELIGSAARVMGLSAVKEFEPFNQVLEYRLSREGGEWARFVTGMGTRRWTKSAIYEITKD